MLPPPAYFPVFPSSQSFSCSVHWNFGSDNLHKGQVIWVANTGQGGGGRDIEGEYNSRQKKWGKSQALLPHCPWDFVPWPQHSI